MQAATLLAALQKVAQGPAMAGIYIKAVQVAAVHDWAHDPIMVITWSMPDSSAYIDRDDLAGQGMQATSISRPADTSISISRHLASPDELESAVLQTAWELGAWDVSRLEHARLPVGAAWHEPRYGLMSDFGHSPYLICGQPMAVGDVADDDTCELAAASGWVTWTFVPMCLTTPQTQKKHMGKDKTLTTSGKRTGIMPMMQMMWWHPIDPHTAHQHIYEMGKTTPANVPAMPRARRASYARRLARRVIQRAEKK